MARPAETWLHEAGPGPAFVEIVRVRRDDPRLLLPRPAQKYVSWLDSEEKQEAVLELAEPGRIVGRSLAEFQASTADFVGQKVEDSTRGEDGDARKALIALGERFLRAKITKDKHMILTSRVFAHLDLPDGNAHALYFVALLDTIEIWSKTFRERVRPSLARSIPDFATRLLDD